MDLKGGRRERGLENALTPDEIGGRMTPGTAVGTESMTELIFIRTKEILCFNIEFFSRFSPAATSKKTCVVAS